MSHFIISVKSFKLYNCLCLNGTDQFVPYHVCSIQLFTYLFIYCNIYMKRVSILFLPCGHPKASIYTIFYSILPLDRFVRGADVQLKYLLY